MSVKVIPTPVAGFTKDTLYFDEQTRLEAARGYASYGWNTGDSTYSILVTSEGWYTVTLKTAEGCTATDSVMMLYSFVPLSMPNAFTPNSDLKNDKFRAYGTGIAEYNMKIFNRWGELLFETDNINTGWDGKYKGSMLPKGIYVYYIYFTDILKREHFRSGSVSLL